MERTLQIFAISAELAPGGPPCPATSVTIAASTLDGLLEAARAKLTAEGYRIRSLSFGPKGLVAYVEERR